MRANSWVSLAILSLIVGIVFIGGAMLDLPVLRGWVVLDGRNPIHPGGISAVSASTGEVALKSLLGVTCLCIGIWFWRKHRSNHQNGR